MNRVLVALLFGAAAGGAITYYSTAERRVTPDAPPSKPVAASPAMAPRSEPVGASAIRRAARPGADRDTSRRSDESPAALVVLSEREPVEALERALASGELAMSEQVLERIAAAWALRDPLEALAHAASISDPTLRAAFESALFRDWVWNDPDAAIAYVSGLDVAVRQLPFAGLRHLAAADPLRMLDVAAGLGDAGPAIASAALHALARQDPGLALAYAEKLPFDQRRQALASVARSYGRRNPEAAIAWARGESFGQQQGLFRMVLDGIASLDPERAFALAVTLPSQQERTDAARAAVGAAARSGNEASTAGRILGLQDPAVRSAAAQALLESWGTTAPREALDWLLAQRDLDVPSAVAQLAQRLGRSDPAAAQQYLARMPNNARANWIVGVAGGYAQVDPRAAAIWIEQFRGDPAYGDGASAVAAALARSDAPTAARLLDAAGNARDVGYAAQVVATEWAARDPVAAAEWAVDVATGPARSQAVSAAARGWAGRDVRAAHGWALSLPSGGPRDAMLAALLAVSDNTESDRTLLDALSTETVRQQAVLRAVMSLSQRGRSAAAREMIASYVTDPGMRRQAEETLDRAWLMPPSYFYF